MIVLGIDPGTTESGWCILWKEAGKVVSSGVWSNAAIRHLLRHPSSFTFGDLGIDGTGIGLLAVEMIASYGMPVGREVFETVLWIGRFDEAWWSRGGAKLVTRSEVKLALCGSPRAKDPNVRQRLIDILGPQGTKRDPGPTYGVKSHAWPALGVALVASGREIPLS